MIKKNIIVSLFLVSLVFPLNANAFFGSLLSGMGNIALAMIQAGTTVTTTGIQGATSVANNGITTGGNTADGMMELTSKLSDDIGLMSNRILTMADKIGEMADRIVQTEKLMADLTRDVANLSNSNAGSTNIVLSVSNSDYITANIAPAISLSTNTNTYLVYVSESIFIDARVISPIQVNTAHSLSEYWSEVISGVGGEKLYIAVKSEGNSISNIVKLNIK